jgi:hypothetical protein
MRAAVPRLVAVALAAALAGCGIDPRTDDLRCGPGSGSCPQGRDCVDGWCVVDPDEVDAGGDGNQCPGVCTRCDNGTCIIECDQPGACGDRVECPSTMPCDVRCSGSGSCDRGVQCDEPRCTITCSGTGSCDGNLDCRNACACVTTCGGAGSCSSTTTCPGPNACEVDDLCIDGPSQCDRC